MMSAKDRLRNGAKTLRLTAAATIVAILAACTSTPQPTPRPAPPSVSKPQTASTAAPRAEIKPAPARTLSNFPSPAMQHLQPRQIALLLPLTGKLAAFGTAIRDGFMAALYGAHASGNATPAVLVYDTNGAENFINIYQHAVADGAQAVIGPLEKPQVAALYQQTLRVPTLALNRAATTTAPPLNLYQFSLAPEDEATSIVRIGLQKNYRHVLIVAPAEEQRSHELQTFIANWQQQGGDITATALFTNPQEISQSIKTALGIPQSEMRRREIEGLFGRKLEFTPHRRGDIDMIFILARPQQARSIVPTLAFHYAGDVPTYALSRSYGGVNAPDLDADIEGLLFTEMPWMLDAQQPLKQQILVNVPGSQNYLRLYALGIDSFHLLPQLNRMVTQPDLRVDGQTGSLTLSPQRIVQRELPLAQIKEGMASSVAGASVSVLPANSDNSSSGRESPHESAIDTP